MARSFPSVQAFAAEVDKLDRAIQREALQWTRKMADNARDEAITQARRSPLGGDAAFTRGWSRQDPRRDLDNLDVKTLVKRTGHIVVPTRKSAGPWKVAESGRRNMTKLFGPLIVQRDGSMANLRFNKSGTLISRRPGVKKWSGTTSGWGVASKARDKSDREAERIAEKELRREINRHFDVS